MKKITINILFFKNLKNCSVLLFFMGLISTSCKKFVDIDPPKTDIVRETVFKNDASATAAISGIYSEMMSGGPFGGGISGFSLMLGLLADEFTAVGGDATHVPFQTNALFATDGIVSGHWSTMYKIVYYANSVIEGLQVSTEVTSSVKTQFLGEAKFIRALCYFYLTNLYGDVPLLLTTDYRINSVAARTSKAQIYDQIILDLKDAQTLLTENYVSGSERVRPNKWAASALLARVYLYKDDYINAESQATTLINNSSIYTLVSNLNNVFLKNSSETILQLIPVYPGQATLDGQLFIIASAPRFALTSNLVNAFEPGDLRRINWTKDTTILSQTYTYPFKYKVRLDNQPVTEYHMVFRLTEQYLIRAEARAQQNNISGSQADLNIIRTRAGLANTTANDKPSLLTAIEKERRIEFLAEWGHRWLDLKRWNRADAVLGPIKAPNWQSTDVLYPIPQVDRNNNPNLTQNAGY